MEETQQHSRTVYLILHYDEWKRFKREGLLRSRSEPDLRHFDDWVTDNYNTLLSKSEVNVPFFADLDKLKPHATSEKQALLKVKVTADAVLEIDKHVYLRVLNTVLNDESFNDESLFAQPPLRQCQAAAFIPGELTSDKVRKVWVYHRGQRLKKSTLCRKGSQRSIKS